MLTDTRPETIAGSYVIDPTHSQIGFSARHAMVTKVRGSFNEFQGSGYFDPSDPSSTSIEVTIDAASIDTASPDRDAHLRSNDFLAMEQYPEIRFKSSEVTKTGADTYRVEGDLELRGVSKPVSIDFVFTGAAVDPYGQQRIGFEGKTTINRKDWGVAWNAPLEAGGVLVSDKVTLELEVSAVRNEDE